MSTEEQILKFHTGYYGEEISSPIQIVTHKFTGEELVEYLLAFEEFLSRPSEGEPSGLPTAEEYFDKHYPGSFVIKVMESYKNLCVEHQSNQKIESLWDALTGDQRLSLAGSICRGCGDLDVGCPCWNDE